VLEQTLLVTRPLPFFHDIRTTNWVKFLYREEYHNTYFNCSLKYFSLSATHLATAILICRLTSDLQERQRMMQAGITCLRTFDTKIIYCRVDFLVTRWHRCLNVNDDYVDVWCVPPSSHVASKILNLLLKCDVSTVLYY